MTWKENCKSEISCSGGVFEWFFGFERESRRTRSLGNFEAGTPGPEARLKAMNEAREAGWRVRLCLDPLLPVAGWHQSCSEMFDALDRAAVWEHLEDVSFGLFRPPKQILRQARRARPDSALLHAAQTPERRGLLTLSGTDQDQLLPYVRTELESRMEPTRVGET